MDLQNDDAGVPLQGDGENPLSGEASAPTKKIATGIIDVANNVSEYESRFHDKLDEYVGKSDRHVRQARNLGILQGSIGFVSLLVAIILSVWMANQPPSSKILGAAGKPVLRYMKVKGRGELIRILLHAGDVKYEERTQKVEGGQELAFQPHLRHGVFHVQGAIACALYAADIGIYSRIIHPSAQQRALDLQVLNIYEELMAFVAKEGFDATNEEDEKAMCSLLDKVDGMYVEAWKQSTGKLKAKKAKKKKKNKKKDDEDEVEEENDGAEDAGDAKIEKTPGENDEEFKHRKALAEYAASHRGGNPHDFLYGTTPTLGDLAIFSFLTMGPPEPFHAPIEYTTKCFDEKKPNLKKWSRLHAMFDAVKKSKVLRPYLNTRNKLWKKYRALPS